MLMHKTMRILKTCIDVLLVVLVALLAILTIVMVVAKIGGNGQMTICGFSFGRVVTGSMEPTIPTGSFILVRRTAPDEIATRDIIMFTSDDPSVPEGFPVTHRVIAIENNEFGQRVFTTQGDANSMQDSYPVEEEDVIGVVISSSKWIGEVIAFSQKPFIYPILIAFLFIDLIFNAIIVFQQAKELNQCSETEQP